MKYGFFQNSSLLAMQLSMPASILFWLFINSSKKLLKNISLLGFLALLYKIILLGSRTAILGLIVALLYSGYPHLRSVSARKKAISISLFLLLAILVIFTFCFKTDSTNGRWFIWKLSVHLWKENWLTGVGAGHFNSEYNHLQAEYFSAHGLYNKEAMLASDGHFAFNEWLQVSIELGILGLLFSVLLTLIIVKCCFRKNNKKDGWAGAAMMAILIACIFSYPLHNFYILCFTALLTGYLTNEYRIIKISPTVKIRNVFFAILFVILIFQIVEEQETFRKFYNARELAKLGYKSDACTVSITVSDKLKRNNEFAFFYCNLLYESNRFNESIVWFNKSHRYNCSHKLHQIISQCYDELGNFKEAEKHLLISLYIKPQLLQSRVNLMNFYYQHKLMDQAIFWAKETVSYPAKFQNYRAVFLKEQAHNFIMQFGRGK